MTAQILQFPKKENGFELKSSPPSPIISLTTISGLIIAECEDGRYIVNNGGYEKIREI